MTEHSTAHTGLTPHTQAPNRASPSKKPKRRPSFFLAKVKSLFQDSQPARTPTPLSQPSPVLHQQVSNSEPPISPPHSPARGSRAKVGAHAFENRGTGDLSTIMMHGVKENLSSLTPSNSSTADIQGMRSQRISQNSTTSQKPGGHFSKPASASGLSGDGTVQTSETTHPGFPAPPSLQPCPTDQRVILEPIVIPPIDPHNIPSPQALPSNGLDALEFDRTDVALADYLIALCSRPTTAERDILRLFFRVRRPGPALSTSTAASAAQLAGKIHPSTTEVVNAGIPFNVEEASLTDDTSAGGDKAIPGDVSLRRKSEPSPPKACQELQRTSAGTSPSPPDRVVEPDCGSTAQRASPKQSHHVTIDDFELIRTLGKGCAGKVRRFPR